MRDIAPVDVSGKRKAKFKGQGPFTHVGPIVRVQYRPQQKLVMGKLQECTQYFLSIFPNIVLCRYQWCNFTSRSEDLCGSLTKLSDE